MQHFLLSAAARTLSLKAVFTMGEDKAYETFRAMRWADTDGDAVTLPPVAGSSALPVTTSSA
jgi:hypothetical protein